MPRLANIRSFAMRRVVHSRWSHLGHAALRKYSIDSLSVRAAALSYWTLLSIVPFLAVAFSVLKAFGVQTMIETFLLEALEPLGAGREEITKRIIGFVSNAEAGVLGAAGVAGLFYTVISLIGSIEEALNQIWRAEPIRAWTRRYSEYLGMLLVGPVLMFAVMALIASAQNYWWVQALIDIRGLGPVIALLAHVLPFFFLWAGFTVLYKIMPSADVRLRSALFGAAVAAILWHLAGMAFTAFVADSINYRAIYSGFAVVVVFFIWLNLAWLIVLVGGMLAYLHQHARIFIRGWPAELPEFAFEEWLLLAALSEIACRYVAGRPPVLESELSDRFGVPLAQIERAIDKCVRDGVLLRSAAPPGISLARPPEDIAVAEILEAARGELIVPTNTAGAIEDVLQRRDAAVRRGLQGITLKSLSQDLQDAVPPSEEFAGEMRRDH